MIPGMLYQESGESAASRTGVTARDDYLRCLDLRLVAVVASKGLCDQQGLA